ncbi:MAG: gliding motility-associated ABC transporter substrate-binding protein GldG [Bacteroidetes bacterium]|nr:MAG: gliding motility-associated ABC transporter substrate-binding protein GldG [Bacteroidota bacterium]
MKKNPGKNNYSWILVLIILVAINFLASIWHGRLDLTSEKRFTISSPTKKLLSHLDDPVKVTVFLDGDLPSGFRKLSNSSREMLQEFRELSGNTVHYVFKKPGQGLDDSAKAEMMDSLRRMGINPTNVRAQAKEGEGEEQRLVYPGALVEYKDRVLGVDLLQGQSSVDGMNSLNNAEALLEYKFANSIDKIIQDSVPVIGYLVGNGEPQNLQVYDLIQKNLKQNYGFSMVPIDSVTTIPSAFSLMMIVKPLVKFTDAQKLKIDQYIMRGGKVMWFIDNLYASLDSLQRSQGNFIAFDLGLNLEDQLFKYGVRINQDLVQDLNCAQIPSVIGTVGDKPQIQLVPWPYFPLLSDPDNNPISKNLDYVLSQFPQSIDTVTAPGIKKTILLSSSSGSRTISTPAQVQWNSVRNEEDLKTFNKSNIPIAVLLEGKFHSVFSNRISSALADTLKNIYGKPFLNQAEGDNKMIVVSDGDLVTNFFSQDKGPLAMGQNPYTLYQYSNREFLMNCMEYLVGNPGILETRGKDYTLRLLDKKKLEERKNFWQMINIILPAGIILILGFLLAWVKRKKYQETTPASASI